MNSPACLRRRFGENSYLAIKLGTGFGSCSTPCFGCLRLALPNQISLWDCVYLALAIEQDCSLITADRRLFRGNAPRHPAIRLLHPRDD